MSTYAYDFDGIREDLAKFAESVTRQSDATSRLLLDHNTEFVRLWDDVAALRDELHDGLAALANRIGNVIDCLPDTATLTDLDNLRAEMLGRIAEATATPFDPERPA